MKPYSPDLSLDELLSDPLVRAMMQADRVDPAKLRRDLAAVTPRPFQRAGRQADSLPRWPTAWDELRHLVIGCVESNPASSSPPGRRLQKVDQPW